MAGDETAQSRRVPSAVLSAVGIVTSLLLAYGALAALPAPVVILAAGALLAVMARALLVWRSASDLLRLARDQAATDELTGLGNRRAMAAEFQARSPEADDARPVVLALFDLDGFKEYNDVFGHPAGDALLVRLSASLSRFVTGRGRAFRMGGDEFCVIFRPGPEIAEPVLRGAAAALSGDGEGFEVTCSSGAVTLPREARDLSSALRLADQRLYADKRGGRITVQRQAVDALLRCLAERHPALCAHLDGVASLAEATARRVGLSEPEVRDVRQAGELHDIGKIAIPEEILAKAGGLDDSDWSFIRRHTLIGERIIGAASPALAEVAGLVRGSHENWDGTGYPDRLSGQEIPLGSRIIFVADAFEAMVDDRSYSPAVAARAALAELRRCSGTRFDPVVVEALCAEVLAREAIPA